MVLRRVRREPRPPRRRVPGARFTADLDEALVDESVDAVALAEPVLLHAEMVMRVLRAGKHCFVEQPMTTTPST